MTKDFHLQDINTCNLLIKKRNFLLCIPPGVNKIFTINDSTVVL